jgi:hypothetical protein
MQWQRFEGIGVPSWDSMGMQGQKQWLHQCAHGWRRFLSCSHRREVQQGSRRDSSPSSAGSIFRSKQLSQRVS